MHRLFQLVQSYHGFIPHYSPFFDNFFGFFAVIVIFATEIFLLNFIPYISFPVDYNETFVYIEPLFAH